MVTLSASITISLGGCGQVFCFSVGIKSTSAIVLSFLLGEEDCLGGAEPLPGLSSATMGGGSVLLPCFESSRRAAGEKLYWLDDWLPSSLNRRSGAMSPRALSFFT